MSRQRRMSPAFLELVVRQIGLHNTNPQIRLGTLLHLHCDNWVAMLRCGVCHVQCCMWDQPYACVIYYHYYLCYICGNSYLYKVLK
jgi:hypothetical protein